MTDDSIQLAGKDLGLIIGGPWDLTQGGVFVYKSSNGAFPSRGMAEEQLRAAFEHKDAYVTIPYRRLREVSVDDKIRWRNRYCYDLKRMGIHSHNQTYFGRGDVTVELLADRQGVEELVDKILRRNIGFSRV